MVICRLERPLISCLKLGIETENDYIWTHSMFGDNRNALKLDCADGHKTLQTHQKLFNYILKMSEFYRI